jgi:hypothetical protein
VDEAAWLGPRRLLFVHVMKTAGSFVNGYLVTRVLRPRITGWEVFNAGRTGQLDFDEEHLEWIRTSAGLHAYVHNHSYAWPDDVLRRFLDDGWFSFCFVRHPGDQRCSYYAWLTEREGVPDGLSLDEFVRGSLTPGPMADRVSRLLDPPRSWPDLDYVAPFTEERFAAFLHDTFGHRYLGYEPQNSSGNAGYDAYRATREISDETHDALLASDAWRQWELISG